ncbi:Ryanodine receptor [Portunus trituberculatus]|uniref:Ryanodine receptor n=1 Tax=Portunus trituberculatus TaxID=210409 RepID=A0A5B7CTI4_PORTR|nr:Ryanodine receptor [Portunus trituberculatus]
MFLKLKDLTGSTTFQDLDMNKDGTVTPMEFKEKMEQQKNYTTEEINFLLMCCDCNHDGKIDYVEFTERFHNPAKEIGFNLAVLLTNLSEHMPNDPRLARFLETAGSVLNYFEPFLGRIEIMGSSKRIERVYFEIKEENIDQWEKPQIKESKRGFFYAIVTEGDKEKLEAFVNFCEDAIFEMQHAAALMEEEDDALAKKSSADGLKYLSEEEEENCSDLYASLSSITQASRKEEKSGPLVPLSVPALPEIREAETGPPAIEHKLEGELLSLEAKPEDPGDDERMKPVLEALAELKEDISPEEAIAAMKAAEKKAVEKQQEEAMQEAEDQPTTAEAEPPPVAQPLFPSISSSSLHLPPSASSCSPPRLPSPLPHPPISQHPGLSQESIATLDTPSDTSTSTGIFSSSTSPGDETTRVRKSITLPTFRPGTSGGVTHSASHQSSFTHSRTSHTQSSVMSSPQSYDLKSPLSLSSKSMQFTPEPLICRRGVFNSLQPTPTRVPVSMLTRTRHTTSPPAIPAQSDFSSELRPTTSKSIPSSLCHSVVTSSADTSDGAGSSSSGLSRLKSPSQSILSSSTSPPQFPQSLSSPAVSLLQADPSPQGTTTSPSSTSAISIITSTYSSQPADLSCLKPICTPSLQSSSSTLPNPSTSSSRTLSPSHQTHIEQEEDVISISISAADTGQQAASPKPPTIFFPSHSSPGPAFMHEHGLCPPSPDHHAFLHPGNVDASQLTPTPPTPTQPHPSDTPSTRSPTPTFPPPTYSSKVKPWVLQRLLSFKASAISEDVEEEEEVTVMSPFAFGSGDLLGSGDEAVLGDDAIDAELGSANFTLGGEEEEEEEEEDAEEWVHMDDRYFYLEHILRLFSVSHSLVALCMLLAYYNLKMPLVIFKREKDVARRLEFDGIYVAEQPEDDDIKAHWDKLVISAKSFPNNYWDKFVKKKVRQKYSETYDFDAISNLLGMETTMSFKQEETSTGIVGYLTSVDWRYQIWKAGVTVTDNQFLYNLWYLTFSVLGNINYFFFAAHLLDVAVSIPSLKTILQSVTHNGKQLILTCMLLTIIVYCYTVIAFNFFRKFYVSEEDDVVDQKCHDMLTTQIVAPTLAEEQQVIECLFWQCFVFHLYKGVRAGGGIGDEIEAPDGDEYEFYRIIFDITFFFFIIVILLAIIQGLIIDAFGELRDQLESVKENLESYCFICGIGSDYFDAVPHGFDMHVLKEHNLANYIVFEIKLKLLEISSELSIDIDRFNTYSGERKVLFCIGIKGVLVLFEYVIHVLVEPEEAGITGSGFKVFHDTGRHIEFALWITLAAKHDMGCVVEGTVDVNAVLITDVNSFASWTDDEAAGDGITYAVLSDHHVPHSRHAFHIGKPNVIRSCRELAAEFVTCMGRKAVFDDAFPAKFIYDVHPVGESLTVVASRELVMHPEEKLALPVNVMAVRICPPEWEVHVPRDVVDIHANVFSKVRRNFVERRQDDAFAEWRVDDGDIDSVDKLSFVHMFAEEDGTS